MPNPSGINQYSGSGGGDKRDSGAGNSHPDHKAGGMSHADLVKSARAEGYSVKGSKHSDR